MANATPPLYTPTKRVAARSSQSQSQLSNRSFLYDHHPNNKQLRRSPEGDRQCHRPRLCLAPSKAHLSHGARHGWCPRLELCLWTRTSHHFPRRSYLVLALPQTHTCRRRIPIPRNVQPPWEMVLSSLHSIPRYSRGADTQSGGAGASSGRRHDSGQCVAAMFGRHDLPGSKGVEQAMETLSSTATDLVATWDSGPNLCFRGNSATESADHSKVEACQFCLQVLEGRHARS